MQLAMKVTTVVSPSDKVTWVMDVSLCWLYTTADQHVVLQQQSTVHV